MAGTHSNGDVTAGPHGVFLGQVFPHSLCFSSSLKYLGGGNEDNGDLPQKNPMRYCHTQRSQPCSRPPPTHASTGDSWTPTGKSGAVSCGVTAPFSWVLVHTRFCCAPQESISQSCVSSGSPMVRLMAISSKRAYAKLKSAAPRAFVPASDHH